MYKKDILEIRKQFRPENCTIDHLCGCYVDGEKDIKFRSKEAFHSLPEDEAFKYFDIFRHTLSGTLGKNMLNMEFPLCAEEEGGPQAFLLQLRDSGLEDDELVEAFYQKVIDNYTYGTNYYIILTHAKYDIPGKASSGEEMFDASDEVYDFILCSICPVDLSKPGLSYSSEQNLMVERMRDWIVGAPMNGFLFPAFEERSTNIHNILYYSKNSEELQPDFVDLVLGSEMPLSSGEQLDTFQSLVSDSLGEHCDFEAVKTVHDTLHNLIEEHCEDIEPFTVSKNEMRQILESCEVEQSALDELDDRFDSCVSPKTPLLASNVTNTKQFAITTPDVVVKVNPERTDLVETRVIDGRQYLLIAVDDHLEVNGITVRTGTSDVKDIDA